MDFTLTINMDNAAFHEHENGTEVARILATVSERLNMDRLTEEQCNLRDYNGNIVGEWKVTP